MFMYIFHSTIFVESHLNHLEPLPMSIHSLCVHVDIKIIHWNDSIVLAFLLERQIFKLQVCHIFLPFQQMLWILNGSGLIKHIFGVLIENILSGSQWVSKHKFNCKTMKTISPILFVLGNPGVTHSVSTAFMIHGIHECRGYVMGHTWVNAVGKEWVMPGLPSMILFNHLQTNVII